MHYRCIIDSIDMCTAYVLCNKIVSLLLNLLEETYAVT